MFASFCSQEFQLLIWISQVLFCPWTKEMQEMENLGTDCLPYIMSLILPKDWIPELWFWAVMGSPLGDTFGNWKWAMGNSGQWGSPEILPRRRG